MVKIFVGNLSSSTTKEDLRGLFSLYGKITECDVLRNFGFVHMDNKEEAEEAVRRLHHSQLNGQAINVELSRGKPRGTTKLHVSNISSGCTNQDLREKFEEFGPVVECDIVKDYAFVHMEKKEDAMEAISALNNATFQGNVINVQLSTSRLRTVPGMGDLTGCYVCGEQGHWSKDCRRGQTGSYGGGGIGGFGPTGGFRSARGFPSGGSGYGRGDSGMYPPRSYLSPGMPPAPPMSYPSSYGISREYGAEARYVAKAAAGTYSERTPAYEHYGGIDYYDKYRARPLGSGYFEDRRLSIPPPPPLSSSSLSRMRVAPTSLNPYDRRPVATPLSSSSSSSSASAYYSRDRSPIRRVGTGSDSYSYERSRLSPVTRSTSYGASQARDTETEQARYAY